MKTDTRIITFISSRCCWVCLRWEDIPLGFSNPDTDEVLSSGLANYTCPRCESAPKKP